jgi:hypothetical protein
VEKNIVRATLVSSIPGFAMCLEYVSIGEEGRQIGAYRLDASLGSLDLIRCEALLSTKISDRLCDSMMGSMDEVVLSVTRNIL